MKNNPNELSEKHGTWQIEAKLLQQKEEGTFLPLSPDEWTNRAVRLVISLKKQPQEAEEMPGETEISEESGQIPEEAGNGPGKTPEDGTEEPLGEQHVYVAALSSARLDAMSLDLTAAMEKGLVSEAVCEGEGTSIEEPAVYTVDFPAADFSGVLRIWAVEGEKELETCDIALKQHSTAPQTPEITVEGVRGNQDWYVETFPLLHIEKSPQSEGGPEVVTWMHFQKVGEDLTSGSALPFTTNPVIAEDGIYELSVYAEDAAGNRSGEATHTIAVATQKPAALFWASEPQEPDAPGGFFRQPVVLRAGAQFGVAGGKLFYRLSEGDWQRLPAEGLRLDEDGRYAMDLLAEDAAGNQSRLSASPIVIDRAINFFTIEGVENGGRFSSDMEITVRMRDSHYKTSACFLQQRLRSGALQDVSDRMEEVAGDASGRILRLQLAQESAQDGCYFLRARVQDQAGNIEEKAISFLVNRFGSLYLFDESTRQLQDCDVQAIHHPLGIVEYNPDVVLQEEQTISLWRDGQRISDPLLERVAEKKEVDQGNPASWHTYRYLLSPENFKQDGAYRIVLSSTDATGNTSHSEQRAGRLTFRVDATPPELTLYDVPNAVKKGETCTISFCATDHIGLDLVTWTLDGQKVQAVQSFSDPTSYEDVLSFPGDGTDHTITFHLRDRAGNENEKTLTIMGEAMEEKKQISRPNRASEEASRPHVQKERSLSSVTAQVHPREAKTAGYTGGLAWLFLIGGLCLLLWRWKRKKNGGHDHETRPL